jgi:hypothetical protein
LYRGHEPFVELVERERSRLTPADSVATMHANILRYFLPAGTRVWSYRLTEDPAVLYGELIAGGATVLYCDRAAENWRYLAPVIRTYPERFRLEAENRAAAIYRVLR